MINLLQVSMLLTIVFYGLFYDFNMLKIWLFFIVGYHIIAMFVGERRLNGPRKVVRMSTWNAPGDPSAFVKIALDITKTEEFIKKINSENPKQKPITLTHVALKSIAQGMKVKPDDYGKIIFGK